jgi:hypothetical protein
MPPIGILGIQRGRVLRFWDTVTLADCARLFGFGEARRAVRKLGYEQRKFTAQQFRAIVKEVLRARGEKLLKADERAMKRTGSRLGLANPARKDHR